MKLSRRHLKRPKADMLAEARRSAQEEIKGLRDGLLASVKDQSCLTLEQVGVHEDGLAVLAERFRLLGMQEPAAQRRIVPFAPVLPNLPPIPPRRVVAFTVFREPALQREPSAKVQLHDKQPTENRSESSTEIEPPRRRHSTELQHISLL